MKKVNIAQPPRNNRTTVKRRPIRIVHGLTATFFVLSLGFAAAGALAQQSAPERGRGGFGGREGNLESLDPGPRGDSLGAGKPIQGLTPQQLAFFQVGLSQFNED